MRRVTSLMINEYKIRELGYDFMGYSLVEGDKYSFHHLIIPRRENGPAIISNGAVLCRLSAHNYLHVIEEKDYDIFCYLTSEMMDMNIKGYLDMENLKRINMLLSVFEKEHCSDRSANGKPLIKESYTKRMLNTKK